MENGDVLVCSDADGAVILAPIDIKTYVLTFVRMEQATVACITMSETPQKLLYRAPYLLIQTAKQFRIFQEDPENVVIKPVAGPVDGAVGAIAVHNERLLYATTDGLYKLEDGKPRHVFKHPSRLQLFYDNGLLLVSRDTTRVSLDDQAQKTVLDCTVVHASGPTVVFHRTGAFYTLQPGGEIRPIGVTGQPWWSGPLAFSAERRGPREVRLLWTGLHGGSGAVDVTLAAGTEIVGLYTTGRLLLCVVKTAHGNAVCIVRGALLPRSEVNK